MTTPALRIVASDPEETNAVALPTRPIDERIQALTARWDEDEAVEIGRDLTAQEGMIEDMKRRHRDEERALSQANAWRLAYWVSAVMEEKKQRWYDWIVETGASALDQSTLYQYQYYLLRVAPENRYEFDVYPSALRLAGAYLAHDPEAQGNFLGWVETTQATTPKAATMAQEMKRKGLKKPADFIDVNEPGERMPDEPAALTELWSRYVEVLNEARELLVAYGMDEDEAAAWAQMKYARGQETVRR